MLAMLRIFSFLFLSSVQVGGNEHGIFLACSLGFLVCTSSRPGTKSVVVSLFIVFLLASPQNRSFQVADMVGSKIGADHCKSSSNDFLSRGDGCTESPNRKSHDFFSPKLQRRQQQFLLNGSSMLLALYFVCLYLCLQNLCSQYNAQRALLHIPGFREICHAWRCVPFKNSLSSVNTAPYRAVEMPCPLLK